MIRVRWIIVVDGAEHELAATDYVNQPHPDIERLWKAWDAHKKIQVSMVGHH